MLQKGFFQILAFCSALQKYGYPKYVGLARKHNSIKFFSSEDFTVKSVKGRNFPFLDVLFYKDDGGELINLVMDSQDFIKASVFPVVRGQFLGAEVSDR